MKLYRHRLKVVNSNIPSATSITATLNVEAHFTSLAGVKWHNSTEEDGAKLTDIS